jgi:hypothetical protein
MVLAQTVLPDQNVKPLTPITCVVLAVLVTSMRISVPQVKLFPVIILGQLTMKQTLKSTAVLTATLAAMVFTLFVSPSTGPTGRMDHAQLKDTSGQEISVVQIVPLEPPPLVVTITIANLVMLDIVQVVTLTIVEMQ